MEDVLEFDPIDVVQRIGGDDVHVGQQECRVEAGVGDSRLDLPARDADLVQHIAVRRDRRIV